MSDFDLIELMSQAVLDPRRWSVVAETFLPIFGCAAVRISACPEGAEPRPLAATPDYNPPVSRDVAAAFRRFAQARIRPEGADDPPALAALYADEADPPEHFHFMRFASPSRPGGVAAIAIHCRRTAAGLTDIPRLRRIQRHLALAVCMTDREVPSDAPRSCARAVLDRLPFPILVVTETGELRFANQAGEDIAAASRGAILRRGGYIEIVDPDLRARFESAIGAAAAIAATGSMPERRDVVVHDAMSEPALRIEVRPICTRLTPNAPETPAALVCLHNAPRSVNAALAPVRAVFETDHRLTRAETGVALAILRGQTIAAYAASRNVSIHTVRSQLRNVFTKTGCRRQADLVRLFLPAGTAA